MICDYSWLTVRKRTASTLIYCLAFPSMGWVGLSSPKIFRVKAI